jgi:hypothetical protein
MFKYNILVWIVIIFVVLICLRIYYESDAFHLKCIISEKDGNRYCVREREKLHLAADLLAEVTEKMKELVKYVQKHHPKHKGVQELVKNFNPKKVCETLPTSELTAYSENKGEKIAFCLNKTKDGDNLIDINTLTFVAIHELGHLMTTTYGHKQDFWLNFKFLLENAKKAKIYDPVDYKKNPQTYCGMTISDSPYYDI